MSLLTPPTRRRAIAIIAAAAGAPFWSREAGAAASADRMVWRGSALGAQTSIEIHHPDRALAEQLLDRCVAQVRHLERQFSLYLPDSAISTLNRTGILVAPHTDMVALLSAALSFAALTGGAFDPTVQPLWQLYADHFSRDDPDPRGPPAEALAEAVARVGHDGLKASADRVVLAKRGAGVTLNGIAQGFATDRVADILRQGGLTTALIDIGEIRALGTRPDGAPWHAGASDPVRPGRMLAAFDLTDRALATSAGAGFRFDRAGQFHHLFDPRSGRSPALYRSVSVLAPTATEADALSTAFSLMPEADIRTVVRQRRGIGAFLATATGAATIGDVGKV